MSLIEAIPEDDGGYWTLVCSSCGAMLDVVDGETIGWLSANNEQVFCMDCDSVRADSLPDCFTGLDFPVLFWINNKPVVLDPWKTLRSEAERREFWRSQFVERTGG